jgi:hypothetical protein
VTAQHVDELEPDRVAERLRDCRHPLGLAALDVGIGDGLAARLPGRPLLFRGEVQVDHQLDLYLSIEAMNVNG